MRSLDGLKLMGIDCLLHDIRLLAARMWHFSYVIRNRLESAYEANMREANMGLDIEPATGEMGPKL